MLMRKNSRNNGEIDSNSSDEVEDGGKLTNRQHMMAMDPMTSIKSMSLKTGSD